MRKSKTTRTKPISISHKPKNDVLLTLVNDCNCALNVDEQPSSVQTNSEIRKHKIASLLLPTIYTNHSVEQAKSHTQ